MIFRIKHRWYTALFATVVGVLLSWRLGAWHHLVRGELPLGGQIGVGVLAGILSIGLDGALHEIFKRALGRTYMETFRQYAQTVLGGMRWPAYITGGLMAALAEEPLFRGVLLPAFDHSVIGVTIAALVFATCHWLRSRFILFWFWAVLEGVLFGLLMVATRSLLVPMIAHGMHDLVGYSVLRIFIRSNASV
jgi:membrane protease YdiL (CAAX protease family)